MKSRADRIALVVMGLAAVAYWAFKPRPVPADFGEVVRGTLEVTVEDEGRTRVRDRYVISAPLPGRMERIELDPGDPVVARKTVVARFRAADPVLLDARTRAELEARVRAAEAAVGAARADRDRIRTELTFARNELKRAQALLEQRVISSAELEQAARPVEALERQLESAEFNVKAAEFQRETARASLLQSRGGGSGAAIPLFSPVDGVVLRLIAESEAVVATGRLLVEVGNLDDLEIVADFLSSAAVVVKPGQEVRIEQWGGDHPLPGRVRLVEPSGFTKISALGVEEQRVNVIVDFTGPRESWKAIGDGYRVEVRVIVWRGEDVLKVPTSSLFRHGDDWAVYRVRDGVASRQIVEIGQRNGLEAEVLKGLDAGDRIVVYPSDNVADGVKVVPRS